MVIRLIRLHSLTYGSMFNHKLQRLFIHSSVLLAALLVAGCATVSQTKPQFCDSFRNNGKGRILCVDYNEAWGDPMEKRHKELLSALKSYGPGRKSAEIRERFGKPRAVEGKIPIKGWPEKASKAQEVWLYTVGQAGWGHNIALCFTDKMCTDSIGLDFNQLDAYRTWKNAQIEAYAPGKTAQDILSRFGEPSRRRGAQQSESLKTGAGATQKIAADETWDYDVLDVGGAWVGMKDGKCLNVALFDDVY